MHILITLIAVLAVTTAPPQATGPSSTSPVVAEVVVGAAFQEVWDLFTTRDGIEAWQVGRASEMELRPGAEWRTSYDEDSNLEDGTVITSEVLAVDPGRMLAMRTTKPPEDFPFPNAILDAWSVLYFEPLSTTETRVSARMFGFTDSPESQEMRAFFEWGNAYELEQLAVYVMSRTQ